MFGKRKRPNPAPWSKDPRVHLDIEEVAASRAIFVSKNEQSRVRITMTTSDEQVIDFELTVEQAAKLIEDTTMVYYAIIPPLRTRRESWQ